MGRDVAGEKSFDGRAIGKVDGVFGVAHDLFKTAKEEDFNVDGLGNARHSEIVTL
jgi:hypothetical protein